VTSGATNMPGKQLFNRIGTLCESKKGFELENPISHSFSVNSSSHQMRLNIKNTTLINIRVPNIEESSSLPRSRVRPRSEAILLVGFFYAGNNLLTLCCHKNEPAIPATQLGLN
jgi:hypothetical protein